MLEKKDLLEMAKNRGVDLGEELAEKGMKEMAHLVLDILGKAIDESENKWDDMIKVALMGKLRDMADKIEVSL